MKPAILPIGTIQHDFLDVVSDIRDSNSGITSEDIWISYYKHGEESVHGKVNASSSSTASVEWTARDGVEFREMGLGENAYQIACPTLGVQSTPILVPKRAFTMAEKASSGLTMQPRPITALAIAPDLSQIASGHADGSIFLQPTPNSTPNSSLPTHIRVKPHLSSLTSLRFFPSSRVLLSGSLDFTLHILPADPATYGASTTRIEPARSLRAHTRPITDTAIVALGRNVLSSSKDGTVRLWDVSSGEVIYTFSSHKFSSVNKIALTMNSLPAGDTSANGDANGVVALDEREVETHDKIVFCALQEGSAQVLDLRTKGTALLVPPPPLTESSTSPISQAGGLTAIAHDAPTNLLATGSSTGLVCLYDIRSLPSPTNENGRPLVSWIRNTASIEDLTFTAPLSALGSPAASSSHPMLTISAEDGLTYVSRIQPFSSSATAVDDEESRWDWDVSVAGEFVGGDCETVRAVRGDSQGGLWCAGDDGIVRMY